MKHARIVLVVSLFCGLNTACSGDDGEGGGSAGSGGLSASGSGGTTSAAGTSAGAASGGTGGSAGSATAGDGGTAGGGGSAGSGTSGGSGGSSGASGGGGSGGGGEDEINCKKSGVGCLCAEVQPQPDAVAICTAESVNGQCCSSESTGFCSCRQWSCENDSLGCSCGSSVDGPLKKCTGNFAVCCLSVIGTASNCYCDDFLTECVGDNDVEVPNCDIEIAPCGDGETKVDACKE